MQERGNWFGLTALIVLLVAAALAGGYTYVRITRGFANWKIDRLIRDRQYSEAQVILNEKLQSHPNSPQLWVLMGKYVLATNDLARAQDAFSHAKSLDPTTAPAIGAEYFASAEEIFPSDAAKAERRLDLAASYDASLAPRIGQLFFEKGKVAFDLHDMSSADELFQKGVGFDSSLRAKVAQLYADAIPPALGLDDTNAAERYAKAAVSYDPGTARKGAQSLFQTLAAGLCNLHSLGKQKFTALMKLSNDLGLPDVTKTTTPHRFAYAMQLYEGGPRRQGIDILTDIARNSRGSCEGVEAKYVLSPPPPGRITVTSSNSASIPIPIRILRSRSLLESSTSTSMPTASG